MSGISAHMQVIVDDDSPMTYRIDSDGETVEVDLGLDGAFSPFKLCLLLTHDTRADLADLLGHAGQDMDTRQRTANEHDC